MDCLVLNRIARLDAAVGLAQRSSRQWSVSLQEIASFGPGRMRPSDLLASSPRDFDAEMRLRSCTTSLAPPTLKSNCSG
jgi:hypothetical protein